MGNRLKDLDKDLETWSKEIVNNVIEEATILMHREVVLRTPVDTGRARGGWKIVEPGLISNNVPYISELENGGSNQAPTGFIDQAWAVVEHSLNKRS